MKLHKQVVKPRSRIAFMKNLMKTLLLTIIIAFVAGIMSGMVIRVRKNISYPIKKVKIFDVKTHDRNEIAGILQPLVGRDIFKINRKMVEKEIRNIQWVEGFRMRIVLPSTIIVNIKERDAVGVAKIDNKLFYFNKDRIWEAPAPIEDGLPLIKMISYECLKDKALFSFIDELKKLKNKLPDGYFTYLSEDLGIKFEESSGIVILLPLHDLDKNYHLFLMMKPLFDETYHDVNTYDFRWEGRIYIRKGEKNQGNNKEIRDA